MTGGAHTNVHRSPLTPEGRALTWAAAAMTEADHVTSQEGTALFRRTVI